MDNIPISSQALPSLTKSTQCGMCLICKQQKKRESQHIVTETKVEKRVAS